MTRLVYFAWVRERIGKAEEEIALPASVVSVADLLNHLKTMGEEYETALQFPDVDPRCDRPGACRARRADRQARGRSAFSRR